MKPTKNNQITSSKKKEINIDFEPHLKQSLAWQYLTDKETTEIGYGGAASGGKSWLAVMFIIIMCTAYPGIAIGLGRKELVTLKKTTKITLYKAFKKYGFRKGRHYKEDGQANTLTFYNGSMIFFLDMAYQPSDPLFTRFGGLELTFLIIDESNENLYEAIKILKTRIGRCLNDHYNLKPKTLETFNPDKGHVFSRFWDLFKKGLLPSYRKFIRALPKDNPYTPKDYLEELEKSDEITRQRLLFGNFDYDDALNKLFKYIKLLDLFSNDFVENGEYYISADCAEFGADKIVIVVWCGLRIVRIVVKQKQELLQTANDIKELAREYSIAQSNIVVDDDGLGKGVTTHLPNCYKFHNVSSALNDENYKTIQAQCLFYLADYVNNNRIHIEEDAIDNSTYKELIILELDVNKRKNADKDGKLEIEDKKYIKKIIGHSPDFRDAILMRMVFEIEQRGGDVMSVIMGLPKYDKYKNIPK